MRCVILFFFHVFPSMHWEIEEKSGNDQNKHFLIPLSSCRAGPVGFKNCKHGSACTIKKKEHPIRYHLSWG